MLLCAVAALNLLVASPASAFDLFATHEVTAQFATPDGKPMVNAEVRAFAPGDPNSPAVTGRTDAEGKFMFAADRDGFWSAEARSPDYVARVMIGSEANSSRRAGCPLFSWSASSSSCWLSRSGIVCYARERMGRAHKSLSR